MRIVVCSQCGASGYAPPAAVKPLRAQKCACGGRLRRWRPDVAPNGRPLICAGCGRPIGHGTPRVRVTKTRVVCARCLWAVAHRQAPEYAGLGVLARESPPEAPAPV